MHALVLKMISLNLSYKPSKITVKIQVKIPKAIDQGAKADLAPSKIPDLNTPYPKSYRMHVLVLKMITPNLSYGARTLKV